MSKRKVVAGVVLGLFLPVAAALAAFTLRADIDGSGNIVQRPTIKFAAASVLPSTVLEVGTCTVTVDAAGVATVTMTDIIQGEACDISFIVERTGGGSSVVKAQDIDFSDVTDDRFINSSCGVEFPTGINVPAHVRFLVPETAPLGTFSAVVDPGSDLVAVNASSYVPANCPTF